MTAIQAIAIKSYEERSDPKPHTVYRIEIQAHVRSWPMWRRYSEFDDLHIELTKSTGSHPPAPLPPKHKFAILRSHSDPALLEERRSGLEAYLRAILGSKESKWRDNHAFKEFLGIPISSAVAAQAQAAGTGQTPAFTLASWLDEQLELHSRLRDVRADIHKREALSNQGDIGASHKSNVAAKQKLAGVLARIGTLGKALEQMARNGMSEGELQRRTDMVARLQDDCEKLGRMVSISRQSGRDNGPMSRAAPPSDREALLGQDNTFKRVTRVFGASSEPQETDSTRPLDNSGLMDMQKLQFKQQDEQLSVLTTILQRQRHLGEAIGHEIASQIELLDSLDADVDRVGGKLTATNRQMNRLG